MKKTIAVFLVMAIALTAGCFAQTVTEPVQMAIAAVDGYDATTIDKLAMKVQTPQAWICLDPAVEQTDEMKAILEKAKMDQAMIERLKSLSMAYFFDTEHMTDSFVANFNVLSSDAINTSQNNLLSGLQRVKKAFENQYSAHPYKNFKWVVEPAGTVLGNNYFIVMVANYTFEGQDMTNCQAMTIYNGKSYTFTYAALQQMYSEEMAAAFEKVLETVEFIK